MISVQHLRMTAGKFAIEASFEVGRGEYFVLLGMTGSGKTLLLETLCGLRQSSSGSVRINGADCTNVEPRDRHIGYVAQDGALFTHLTVEGNIGFALKTGGVRSPQCKEMVRQISTQLGIEHLLKRKIHGLSGGECQRVSIARALVANPDALLFDEPVSALDEYTRGTVCREMKTIQRKLNIPVIHVCHSFEEAMLVADTMGIMEGGRIIQSGKPDDLVNFPATVTVARLLRHPNIFSAVASGINGTALFLCNGVTLKGPAVRGALRFLIRPWQVRPIFAGDKGSDTPGEETFVESVVNEFHLSGPTANITVGGPLPITLQVSRNAVENKRVEKGAPITLAIPSSALHVLREDQGNVGHLHSTKEAV